ncbi:hypothetical protein EJ04DRAFT_577310 [Polyplosphaeria fusca]|uniref:Uncharacterized protein n=1 Tax=Polyplosphaeria fusca TaxID=682080 RepID=A0A9P4V276_9PLEO|nr:hypothetical protein EJ04DRAFT_577310 [Polyplosphaeria fusca]
MKNVAITSYEDDALSEGQSIRIDLKPAEFGLPSPIASTLEFDAERTEWNNYDIKRMDPDGQILVFALIRNVPLCGFLSLAPANNISDGTRSQAARTMPKHDRTWSLVRTYRLQLTPWDGANDDLQELLEEIEKSEDNKRVFAKKFRERLQQSSVLSILLVRPKGQFWERIGSGLIFEKDWSSTNVSKQANIQAYQEHIVLI